MTKVKKIRSVKFTKIANEIFDDYRLSYKEIGIYCNMMKFPEDWEFSIRYLADCHHDKKGSVRSGIDTLLKYGYIARDQYRNKRGRFESVDYFIFEDPTDNPYYIPCPPRSETADLYNSPLTENQTPVNSQKRVLNTGKDHENDENSELPRAKNRYAVETDESAPLTEKRDADNRDAVFPPAENHTQQNTVLTIMTGSVSSNKMGGNVNKTLQMMQQPLMSPDQIRRLKKGKFILMKTSMRPAQTTLHFFKKLGIEYNARTAYSAVKRTVRKVEYASKESLDKSISADEELRKKRQLEKDSEIRYCWDRLFREIITQKQYCWAQVFTLVKAEGMTVIDEEIGEIIKPTTRKNMCLLPLTISIQDY